MLAVLLMVGGVIGAQFGVAAGERLKGEQLRFLLAGLVLLVGLRFAWQLIAPSRAISIRFSPGGCVMRARPIVPRGWGVTAMLAATFLLLGAGEGERPRPAGTGPATAQEGAGPGRQGNHAGQPARGLAASSSPARGKSVQADVSARTVSVTSSFNGTEIVIFGAVDNSQQPSAESGYYDVVIVVEGVPGRVVARRRTTWRASG